MTKNTTLKLLGLVTTATLLVTNVDANSLKNENTQVTEKTTTNTDIVKPKYQGLILEVLDAKAYTYLKIDEKISGDESTKLKSFWIVVNKTSAKVGDYVRFEKELVTKMFKSKELNRTFDEVMFASNLEYRVSK